MALAAARTRATSSIVWQRTCGTPKGGDQSEGSWRERAHGSRSCWGAGEALSGGSEGCKKARRAR
eukprot:875123-Prymnesium_polylepis.1